ncbi:MAG: phage tail assembly protein [Candidatus Brevundimonas colombiensis]|uniref:Phage tail assembly protein n=1 Tax=Candidatus Brevundimonas colombiensis TaxID=3121376 RepID=A0AAJ6BK70_9CAUL|nr:phage tail assembly protein [Brevundimonas sp.]WEK38689.1 MAG: phage tail assembly protein [Brevundimonas sp.]
MIDPNKTFDLKAPFDHEGQNVAQVRLRRPKGREIREMRNKASQPGAQSGDITFAMMANLAEQPEALFDEMDGVDVRQIETWLETLLGN